MKDQYIELREKREKYADLLEELRSELYDMDLLLKEAEAKGIDTLSHRIEYTNSIFDYEKRCEVYDNLLKIERESYGN